MVRIHTFAPQHFRNWICTSDRSLRNVRHRTDTELFAAPAALCQMVHQSADSIAVIYHTSLSKRPFSASTHKLQHRSVYCSATWLKYVCRTMLPSPSFDTTTIGYEVSRQGFCLTPSKRISARRLYIDQDHNISFRLGYRTLGIVLPLLVGIKCHRGIDTIRKICLVS